MRKIRSLIGMPVICSRRRIGRLAQADLSDDLRRLEGIWVDSGLAGTRYIPAEHLNMLGERAVLAEERGHRRKCTGRPIFYRAVSTNGQRLGAIVGAEVDEISFLVCALELTMGFWDDLTLGRRRVEAYQVHRDQVVVLDSTQDFEREEEP